MAQLLPPLGNIHNATSAKPGRTPGGNPRPDQDPIVATAESLLRLAIVGSAK